MSYSEYVKKKLGMVEKLGFSVTLDGYGLYPHQKDLTEWTSRKKSSECCKY